MTTINTIKSGKYIPFDGFIGGFLHKSFIKKVLKMFDRVKGKTHGWSMS